MTDDQEKYIISTVGYSGGSTGMLTKIPICCKIKMKFGLIGHLQKWMSPMMADHIKH